MGLGFVSRSPKRDRPPPPTNDLSGELGQNDEDADDSFKIISPHNHIFSSETSSLKSEIPSVLFRGSVDVRDDSPNGVVSWRWLSEEAG